jgi:serine/threonine protein kinase
VPDQEAPSAFRAEPAAGLAGGAWIAGYRLEEQIGRGGMAVVFRARDEQLGRLVALKVLAPALAGDEDFRQRFIRESRAAAAVDDPHIIPVFEAREAGGVLFIAMRYVPGGDVQTLVRDQGPLSPARAASILSPVASALDAAHAAGLIHRDVKPGNMLVDTRAGRPDHVYLSDFGLSKRTLSTSAGLTASGGFMGTLDYISPEQIAGRPVDGRADQYALACAAFEMLTGAPPFRSGEPTAVMYAQLSQPPPALTSRRPDLPRPADQALARALAKAPGDRYRSCREFADALRGAFGLAPYDSASQPSPAAGHPGPTGRHDRPEQAQLGPELAPLSPGPAPLSPEPAPQSPEPAPHSAGPTPHSPEPAPHNPEPVPHSPWPGPDDSEPATHSLGPAPHDFGQATTPARPHHAGPARPAPGRRRRPGRHLLAAIAGLIRPGRGGHRGPAPRARPPG